MLLYSQYIPAPQVIESFNLLHETSLQESQALLLQYGPSVLLRRDLPSFSSVGSLFLYLIFFSFLGHSFVCHPRLSYGVVTQGPNTSLASNKKHFSSGVLHVPHGLSVALCCASSLPQDPGDGAAFVWNITSVKPEEKRMRLTGDEPPAAARSDTCLFCPHSNGQSRSRSHS